MGKVVLLSNLTNDNTKIHSKLWNILPNEKNLQIGYVPSCADSSRKHFNTINEIYKQNFQTEMLYFDIDKEYQENRLNDLLSCKIIHLSGGDPSYFLNSIRKRNFNSVLKNYLSSNGIIVGVSAGAMIMTKTIKICEILPEDINVNQENALSFVNFEFFPHSSFKESENNDIQNYATNNNVEVYSCSDLGFIEVEKSKVTLFGEVKLFNP